MSSSMVNFIAVIVGRTDARSLKSDQAVAGVWACSAAQLNA